jgi:hypothetical protein
MIRFDRADADQREALQGFKLGLFRSAGLIGPLDRPLPELSTSVHGKRHV